MFLDVRDLRLLELLKQNSRAKLKTLAQNLNLTASAVKYRIDRLVECGIIDKFTISLNRRKVGYEILAHLVIDASTKSQINMILDYLKDLPEVSRISVLMGDPDIIVDLNAYSYESLVRLLKRISQIEEIQTFKTWFVMDEIIPSKKNVPEAKESNLLSESPLKKARSNI